MKISAKLHEQIQQVIQGVKEKHAGLPVSSKDPEVLDALSRAQGLMDELHEESRRLRQRRNKQQKIRRRSK